MLRDHVKARMEAQRGRFVRRLADRIQRWSAEEQITPLLLVGEAEESRVIREALPADLRNRTEILEKTLQFLSAHDVKKRLEPILNAWERKFEAALVDELVSARHSQRAVAGVDETLAQLQKGRVRELVIARGITGVLRECVKCGWSDRSADLTCATCGSKRRSRSLRTAVPELASRHAVPVEVVSGAPAKKLHAVKKVKS